jgi:hypothetical protein
MQTKNGETFVSETDTEVIPKLLKFAYDSMTAEQQQDSSSGTAQVPFPKVGPGLSLQELNAYKRCAGFICHSMAAELQQDSSSCSSAQVPLINPACMHALCSW